MMPGNDGGVRTQGGASAGGDDVGTNGVVNEVSLEGFAGIGASFEDAERATISAGYDFASGDVLLDKLVAAIMKFLIVFDALGSPILATIVGKDFESKSAIIHSAARRESVSTVKELVEIEEHHKSHPAKGARWGFIPLPSISIPKERGTEALFWCNRVMSFVDNLVLHLINDEELGNAALMAYRNTLANNHNGVTRGIFENALHFLPDTNTFLRNLYNIKDAAPTEEHVQQLKAAMKEFRKATKPHIEAFQAVFPE